ncbi:hypothetical protein NC651_009038 [Populus alba x Populus x berolinensis]|nr:hypothetical protein NC651_009038 [Populus alba x Populus x berolinensis]
MSLFMIYQFTEALLEDIVEHFCSLMQ